MVEQVVIDGLIGAVREAARAVIIPRFRTLAPVDTKSGPEDLVTVADRATERAIAAAVARLMPEALVVGEEAAHDDRGLLDRLPGASIAVIVDPVDGTANFAAGLAVFGVILAVMEAGQTTFGLLYDPLMDDWVSARRGKGAWYVRPGAPARRLTGRRAPPPSEAQGYLPLFLFPRAERARIGARIARFGRIGSLRCSCHEYRMLALGQVDFVLSPHGKPWDHAAGALIVEEIGGRIEAGGVPGYDPARPRVPVLALADRTSTLSVDELLG